MAKTIANFLVGVGLDTKNFDQGSRNVDTALSGFRSKAQLAGGALTAAFSAAGLAAISAGTKADEFMRRVEKFSTAPRFIYNLGNAFYKMGGQDDDAIKTIEKTEGILDALRKGDASALEAAGLAQVDVSQLQRAQNGEELLASLADVLSRTPNTTHGEFQRRSLAETFGLSNEGLKLLTQGRDAMYAAANEVDKYAGNLEKAAIAGRDYSQALAGVNLEFKKIGDTLAVAVLPQFTSLLRDFTGFLNQNAPKVKSAADFVLENPGATAAVGGGLAAGMTLSTIAAISSKLGLKMAAGAASGGARLGYAGAALGAMHGAYEYVSDGKGTSARDLSDQLKTNPNAVSDYIRAGTVNGLEAASTSPSAEAARKPTLSQMARSDASIPPMIQVDSTINLDGYQIGKVITKHQLSLIHI